MPCSAQDWRWSSTAVCPDCRCWRPPRSRTASRPRPSRRRWCCSTSSWKGCGLEGLTLIKSRWPGVPVVMLSANHGPETVRLALGRGAAAFVSKAETADRIVAVVRQALYGVGEAIEPQPDETATPEDARLTPRQCEVLDLLCQGLSNKVIARRLELSEFTVRGHVQSVLRHLHVSSRSEAAFAARQRGLVG